MNESQPFAGLSDADYRRHFQTVPTQLLILDRGLRVVDVNPTYCENTGASREALLGNYIFDVLPSSPEVRAPVEEAFSGAFAGEETTIDDIYYPMPDPDKGPDAMRDVWWRATHRPLRSHDGDITHIIQLAEPITEEIRSRELSTAILDELEHRISNLLALILTIAKRTARNETSVEEFMTRFQSRVISLAQTQALLTGPNWRDVTFSYLLEKHLLPFRDGEEQPNITLNGPDVPVSARQAQALSMALHELTTNAAKYGALAMADAQLEITWSGEPERDFRMVWAERGLKLDGVPTRKGFGHEILTIILPSQISAKATQDYTDDGFTYTLETKVSESTSA